MEQNEAQPADTPHVYECYWTWRFFVTINTSVSCILSSNVCLLKVGIIYLVHVTFIQKQPTNKKNQRKSDTLYLKDFNVMQRQ